MEWYWDGLFFLLTRIGLLDDVINSRAIALNNLILVEFVDPPYKKKILSGSLSTELQSLKSQRRRRKKRFNFDSYGTVARFTWQPRTHARTQERREKDLAIFGLAVLVIDIWNNQRNRF